MVIFPDYDEFDEFGDVVAVGTKTLVPGGHAFRIDINGGIVYYEHGDYHGGPECAKCNWSWCQHCNPKIFEEKCPEDFETLPGLEFD